MEMHIIASPLARSHVEFLRDALHLRWPFARVVPLPAGIRQHSTVYRPPALAVIAHAHPGDDPSDDIIAIRQRSDCPIVIYAPEIDEPTEIAWLLLGADVVVGTASTARMAAILAALMRRIAGSLLPLARTHTIGDLTFDATNSAISVGDRPLRVTPTEYRLLESLAVSYGSCVGSSALMYTVWGMDDGAVRKSLKVHMSRLRHKLLEAGSGCTVNAVRSYGYVLEGREPTDTSAGPDTA